MCRHFYKNKSAVFSRRLVLARFQFSELISYGVSFSSTEGAKIMIRKNFLRASPIDQALPELSLVSWGPMTPHFFRVRLRRGGCYFWGFQGALSLVH